MEIVNKRKGTKANGRKLSKCNKNETIQDPLTSTFMAKYSEAEPLQACRVCLLTDCRLFSMQKLNFMELFKQLTGLRLKDVDNFPSSLCAECALFLDKCKRFREKSRKSQALLNLLLKKTCPVTITQIKQVNRKANNLCSSLSVNHIAADYCDTCLKEVYEEEITGLNDNPCKTELKTDLKENESSENRNVYGPNYLNNIIEFENDDDDKGNDNYSSTRTEIKSNGEKDDNYLITRTEIEIVYEGNDNHDKMKIEFENDTKEKDNIKETSIKQPKVGSCNNLKSRKREINFNESHFATNEQKRDEDKKRVRHKPLKAVNKLHPRKGCGKVLRSKAGYLVHLRSERHPKHVCCLCGLSFVNERKLQLHQKRMHLIDNLHIPKDGPRCTKCSMQFLSEEALHAHLNGISKDTKTSQNKYNSDISEELKSKYNGSEKNEEHNQKQDDVKETKTAVERVVETTSKNADEEKKAPKTQKIKKKTDTTRRSISDENELLKNTFEIKKLTFEEQLDALQKRKYTRNYNYGAYKCEICYKATNFKKTLDIHMARHDENFGNRSCDVCHLRFKTYHELYHHKRGHETQYGCLKCPFTSFTFDQAKRHMEFHEGKTFTCEQCSETFRKKGSYLSHRRVKHPPSTHVCCLCGFSFLNQQGMRVHHFRKHLLDSTEIPADGPSCEECSLQFLNDEALLTHLRISPRHNTHPKIRNDSVALNRMSPNIKRAINELSKEKKCDGYDTVCELCGRFVRWFELESHLQEHSGHRYQCTMCDKTFKNKKTWYSHKYARHSGPRTRNCDNCGKLFSSLSNLVRHVRKVHSKTVFECEICHKPFKDLKQHIEHVHLNKPWPKRARH